MLKNLLITLFILFTASLISTAQYCLPTYSIACTSNDFIDNFSTTGGISNITNNGTGCSAALPNNYIFYSTQTVSQIQGFSFNFSVQAGTTFSQGFRIWIDWNQDLDFADPGEDVYVSPNASTAPFIGTITVPVTAIPGPTRMRVLCRYAIVPTITDYCGTSFSFGECEDYLMNVIAATPCSGTPNAGTINPSNTTICAGQSLNLGLTGATYQGNMTYQWQQSTNGGTTWSNAVGGFGATTPGYQTPALNTTTMYRMFMLCNGSGLSDTTAPMTITVSGPTYVALPYVQDFEAWSNYCSTTDVPNDAHWLNSPATGPNSWRRNDQGSSANWLSVPNGMYYPAASSNVYSARFHSYYTSLSGNLDMFVDCSTQLGNKTMFFDYINDNSFGGFDYLEIQLSTDGGVTFNPLGSFNNSITWQTNSMTISSNSATTVVRFRGVGDFGFNQNSDIGLDNVVILPPCTGTPTAGAILNTTPCANVPFDIKLTGNALFGGLIYDWESAPTATGPWTNIGTTAGPVINTQIGVATYFRCIVTCQASGLADTTAAQLIDLASFYYCYCVSQASPPSFYFQNIGNVTMFNAQNNVLINNGTATPLLNNSSPINLYSSFAYTVPVVDIYRDSTYSIIETSFSQNANFYNGFAAVYIDYNRDGIFDPISEMVTSGVVNPPLQQMSGNFTVPNNAQYGLTGMRVVYEMQGTALSINPCGTYSDGETEDYLVNISLSPCKSPPNAGIAYISDTITCPGYTVFLADSTHDLTFQNLTFNWQFSTDGINYSDIPGAVLDTLTFTVNSNTWFRFRTTCNGNSDAYSNIVSVVMSPPFACYGNSQSTGGSQLDSSDIGAFIISEMSTNNNIYSFISGGPHLLNPTAIKRRTDYTNSGAMELITDSLYKMSIYHIMRSATHSDAKVTVFIDYNNNQVYDIPSERIFSGIADINNFYLVSSFQTPVSPALNVATGLRVVLNNDLSANAASDNGVGTYISGETEDYLVKFKLKQLVPSSVDNVTNLQEIGVYPNPTTGKFYIGFNATKQVDVAIEIINMMGSILETHQLNRIQGSYVTELNLSNYAKGTYLIKLNTNEGNYVRRLVIE